RPRAHRNARERGHAGPPRHIQRAKDRQGRRAVLATMVIATGGLVAVPLLLRMQFAALSNRPDVPLDKALGLALSRKPCLAGGRQRAWLARAHATLLGSQLRHPA